LRFHLQRRETWVPARAAAPLGRDDSAESEHTTLARICRIPLQRHAGYDAAIREIKKGDT
jgi:hypothetical protein